MKNYLLLFSVLFIVSCVEEKKESNLPLEDGTTFYYTKNGKTFTNDKFVYNKTGNKFSKVENYSFGQYENDCLIQDLTINEQNPNKYYVWKETYWDICDRSNYGRPHKEHFPEKWGDRYVSECMVVIHELSYTMNKDLSILTKTEEGKTFTYKK